ncbi:hypothetical protein Tco_0458446 [Tanacetum coccineum]
MEDQPLPADASSIALSLGYIANSDPEEDKEDPEEDPADHPKDEEEEEYLAPVDPPTVPTDDPIPSS